MTRSQLVEKGKWILVSLFLLYGSESLFFVLFGDVGIDEGWYLYAAKLAYRGQLPYLDFAHFQAPLLPYIYGLPLKLFGSSLLVGRATSLVVNLIMVFALIRLAQKLGGTVAAMVTLVCLATFPVMLRMFNAANNPTLATALTVLGTCMFLTRRQDPARSAFTVVALGLAAATRISFAPAAIFVTSAALVANRHYRRNLLLILLTALLVNAVVWLPFFFRSYDRTTFNLFVAQLERSTQWAVSSTEAQSAMPPARLFLLSTGLLYIAALGILAMLVIYTAVGLLDREERSTWRTSVQGGKGRILLFLSAMIVLLYLPNLATGSIYPDYMVSAAPFTALLAGVGLAWIERRGPVVVASVLLSVAAGFVSLVLYLPMVSSTDPPELAELREVSDYIRSVLPPDQLMFTLDTTLAVQADRDIVPGTEMESHSYWPLKTRSECERYHLINREIVDELVSREDVGAIILSEFELWLLRDRSVPYGAPLDPLTEDEIWRLWPDLKERYRLDRVFLGSSAYFGNNVYILTALACLCPLFLTVV